jgi:hypothetical protein
MTIKKFLAQSLVYGCKNRFANYIRMQKKRRDNLQIAYVCKSKKHEEK